MGRRKYDIERYLKGKMTASEMHALEKQALHDPFLSEALEGIDRAGSENFLFDLKDLHHSLRRRTKTKKIKVISTWNLSLGIAATLILLAVSTYYMISIINAQRNEKSLASNQKPLVVEQNPKALEPTIGADSVVPTGPSVSEKKSQAGTVAEKPKQPASTSVRDLSGVEKSPVASFAQTESIEKERQKIVEADLTEAPEEIQAGDDLASEPKKSQVASEATGSAQRAMKTDSRLVHGKVLSTEDGNGLPGVNVLVKGTNIGTITDAEGNYQVRIAGENENLVFSFIGLKDVEVPTKDKDEIDVHMSADYSQLSEVVVTGYGKEGSENNFSSLQFAEPVGGRKAFQKYLSERKTYPAKALENKIEGRVTVQFTVQQDGQLADFKIIKGLGYGCDDEVIRLIKEGPAWSPSKRNDQPVADNVKVRLKFDIPDKK